MTGNGLGDDGERLGDDAVGFRAMKEQSSGDDKLSFIRFKKA